MDLQCCKIELIKVVARFFFYRGGELLLLLHEISFRTRQPARDDMKGGSVAIGSRDAIQGFPCYVELPKAQCR